MSCFYCLYFLHLQHLLFCDAVFSTISHNKKYDINNDDDDDDCDEANHPFHKALATDEEAIKVLKTAT